MIFKDFECLGRAESDRRSILPTYFSAMACGGDQDPLIPKHIDDPPVSSLGYAMAASL
jgi:hypothetical protein